jgi:hypothetical protein
LRGKLQAASYKLQAIGAEGMEEGDPRFGRLLRPGCPRGLEGLAMTETEDPLAMGIEYLFMV